MKKKIWIPIIAVMTAVFFAACMKKSEPACTNNSLTQDKHVIDSFLNKTSGFEHVTFNTTYNVYMGRFNQGAGSAPAADSQVVFKQQIYLLNSTLVDETVFEKNNQGAPLRLSDLGSSSNKTFYYDILTQLREGGRMDLLVPSSTGGLATGCMPGQGNKAAIPAYAQLIYSITLTDVKPGQ